MSLPDEERRALRETWEFLLGLSSGEVRLDRATPVRERARELARHFPLGGHVTARTAVPPDGELLGGRFVTGVGQVLRGVHAEGSDCHEHGCVIHNPSDHAMRAFPTLWRGDRGIMERLCPHGVGHPDPDDQAYITRVRGEGHAEGVHGCDGCCRG